MRVSLVAAVVWAVVAMATTVVWPMLGEAASVPRYQHIFLIMMENQGYSNMIGNAHTPHINDLARRYGLATQYYGVTHPSEPNYVALIGGDYFGIQDDASYATHPITSQSLATQLERAHLNWTAYEQSLPVAGYMGTDYPTTGDSLYVSKHNPFLNFAAIQTNPAERRHIVPATQLASDLARSQIAAFSFITPDLCHDMHGGLPACPTGTPALLSAGDRYVGAVADAIMRAPLWKRGNNALVIVWDESDSLVTLFQTTGCCNASAGGGQVPAIVITNHGPRGIKDATPYNHYALLRTIQQAFGLGCLRNTCDTAHVPLMSALFGGSPPTVRSSMPPTAAPGGAIPLFWVGVLVCGLGLGNWAVHQRAKLATARTSTRQAAGKGRAG